MRSLIAVATLVASVSASAGELDGKAISCDRAGLGDPVMWEFRDGRPVQWSVEIEDIFAVIGEEPAPYYSPEYKVSPTAITWERVMFSARLDRATLELFVSTPGDIEVDPPPAVYQCEVYTSLSDFKEMMRELVAQKQAEIDEQMKDNKI